MEKGDLAQNNSKNLPKGDEREKKIVNVIMLEEALQQKARRRKLRDNRETKRKSSQSM